MESNSKNFDLENDPIITALIETIQKKCPKVSIINPKRWLELLLSKEAFDDLLKQNGESTSKITYFPEFLSASLSAEVECLEVHDFVGFQISMEKANNFEIYPLTNGKMRISFMFNQMMLRIE